MQEIYCLIGAHRKPSRSGTTATSLRLASHASPNGDIAEIFLSSNKPGSEIEAMARDAAVTVSIALQCGTGLETIRSALTKDDTGGPATLLGAALSALPALAALDTSGPCGEKPTPPEEDTQHAKRRIKPKAPARAPRPAPSQPVAGSRREATQPASPREGKARERKPRRDSTRRLDGKKPRDQNRKRRESVLTEQGISNSIIFTQV
jgi:hypothetical protein